MIRSIPLKWRLGIPLTVAALALAMALLLPIGALAQTADSPWTGSGSGTTVVVSDGSSAPAEFTYNNPGSFSGSWEFKTTAASAGTHTLDWDYSGLHSFFQVTATLDAFVNATTVNLVNAGPTEDCPPCTSPSNGFAFSGTETFIVGAGDMYGFRMSGSHFDSAGLMSGTLTVDEPGFTPPPTIDKTLLEGPLEIGIALPGPTQYVFQIDYSGPAALVVDTVPAEFECVGQPVASAGTATCAKNGNSGKSSNRIEWNVPAGTGTLTVDIQTVQSPSGKLKFKPTSCGDLPINDGAIAYEVDANGELVLVEVVDPVTGEVTLQRVVIVGPSNSLGVEAVAGEKPCEEDGDGGSPDKKDKKEKKNGK